MGIFLDILDLFEVFCLLAIMVHHHLGEYVWNFFPSMEEANPRQ